MRSKKSDSMHGVLQLAIFGIIVFLFCYFRLKPIYFQTVGYTYDQGRDFLKAAEIVLYHNPTFIGPTTGIGGVYHGAWWYYLLAVAFLFTGGVPIGFYYFNFMIQSIAFLIFIFFTRRYFGFLTSAILSFLVATSGHFIFTTIFMGNNVMAIPAVLAVTVATILLTSRIKSVHIPKTPYHLPIALFAGLGLGFVSEFEFAFGLMLIPVYILLLAMLIVFRKVVFAMKDYFLFIIGLGIPFIPRLLFELKNSFPQAKVLINFIFHPAYHTPKPYMSIWTDRVETFRGYFLSIFMSDTVRYIVVLFLIAFIVYRIVTKQVKIRVPFIILLLLTTALFLVSTLYKDTFWSYYYDGIQYLFLCIAGFIISFYSGKTSQYADYAKAGLLGILLILGLVKVGTDMQSKYVYDGIKVQQDIVAYIQSQEKDQPEYCLQIYTPPVIPYTYNYMFLYKNTSQGTPLPKDTWVRKRCWFIIEHDDNNERLDAWIADHVPLNAKRITNKTIKDVRIEQWHLQPSYEAP